MSTTFVPDCRLKSASSRSLKGNENSGKTDIFNVGENKIYKKKEEKNKGEIAVINE